MATAIRRSEAELKALMPNQVIPPIGSDTVEPTWQQIQICSTLCAANAASIDSDGGDGLLGHVFIVIGGERYEEISDGNVAYIEPPLAGPPPTYPANMSYHDKERSKNELISRPIRIITPLSPSRKSLRNRPWTLFTPTTSRASTLKSLDIVARTKL
jgi:hypothetical protein